MWPRLFVVLSCFFMTAANAALPTELTGREHAEVMLLLSQSDFDVRLAAKSLYRLGSDRQEVLDLFAEVTWTACSGNREMRPDTLSWLAKALGNTKQTRYTHLLDYCLSSAAGKNTIKHLKEARASLEGTTTNYFEGGKIDLGEIRARLAKKSSSATHSHMAKQFGELREGQSLDNIYSIFGIPNDVSGTNVPLGKAGYLYVKVKTSNDMILLGYSGLGKIRFVYGEAKANWLLADADGDKGPFWSKRDGRFLTTSD
jgi:hypothetical protein